jgi:hypothetical protein
MFLRKATNSGRPFGSETFVDLLAFRLNQVLKLKKPGRPKKKCGGVSLVYYVFPDYTRINDYHRTPFCPSLGLLRLQLLQALRLLSQPLRVPGGTVEQG